MINNAGVSPMTSPITNKVIVLDLDSTLVHTFDQDPDLNVFNLLAEETKRRTYLLSYDDDPDPEHWGVTRPYLNQFLSFCFSYFPVVAVWSAGQKHYVHEVVKAIFQGVPQPHIILTRDDCVTRNGVLEKPLSKMFPRVTGMGLHNTFFLDDRPAVYRETPNNGIEIPIYEPDNFRVASSMGDMVLLQLMTWLQRSQVAFCPDVRTLDKTQIFDEFHSFISPMRLARPKIMIPTIASVQADISVGA